MNRLLKNALESIRVGVEDYETQEDVRALSAVRNLHAGLLLLAKWVLVKSVPNASEDEVIRAAYEPEPDGEGGVKYVPGPGKQTIGLQDIHRRFKRFGLELEPTTKHRLDSLARVRNDIEHRYVGTGAASLRQTVSQAFLVAAELFRLADVDPFERLGDAWGVMLEVNEVYKAERDSCWATFETVEWGFPVRTVRVLECPGCRSELVEHEDPYNTEQDLASGRCRSCGEEMDAEAVVEQLVKSSFEWVDYVSVKETGERVLFSCPSCLRETYLNEADDDGELTGCLICGFKLGDCGICGTGLNPDNLYGDNDGLCSYCGYKMA